MESLASRVKSAREEPDEVREARAQKDEAILVLLAKLALVYWRPDFSPQQAKELYSQYLDDLRDLPFTEIICAAEKYRRNPENKFFPTPGQLRGIVTAIPAWDVNTPKRRMLELHTAAHDELESRSAAIGSSQPRQITANAL